MKSRGFTIVEVLVVIAVLAVVGIILTEIFFRSVRGGSKAVVVANIKQNGQTVLNIMDRTIRNADSVLCPAPGSVNAAETIVVLKNGVYTRYRFIEETVGTNGLIQTDNPVPVADEVQQDFINSVCPDAAPIILPTILTDTNPKTGVSIQAGSQFTRDQLSGFKDIVIILVKIGAGVEGASILQIDPVEFKTTIELR